MARCRHLKSITTLRIVALPDARAKRPYFSTTRPTSLRRADDIWQALLTIAEASVVGPPQVLICEGSEMEP
jgi:hypothetical protein